MSDRQLPEQLTHGDPREGTVEGVWRKIIRAPLYLLLKILIRIKVEGMENIPKETGVLVISNHMHNADPVVIEIAFPRAVHFMAKEELYRFKPLAWLITKFGNFPVARGKSDRKAVRAAINRLHYDVAVGLFPEGTRSKTTQLSHGRTGAGFIAIQGKSPILPLAITGTERLPFNFSGKRPDQEMPDPGHTGVRIRIGTPFELPATGPDGKRLSAAEATEIMMHAIADLLPEDYRGVYRSSDSASESSDSASSAALMN